MADPITQVVQSLGLVTAYGYAKSKGYTGTEEEFAEAAAAIGQGAATASAAAEAASEDAETATTAAGTATTAAGNAENSATAAMQYMNNAETAATNAGTAQTAAAGSATSAAASAQAAATSEYNAGVAAGASSDYALVSQDHSEDSEAWAVGTKNGTDVPATAEQYHNNAKYYADLAETQVGDASASATAAASSATAAAASAVSAEAWATGGSGGTASATNNAEYWAGQAAAQAEAAAGSAASGIAALANEAPTFSPTTSYTAGEYVLYNGVLYQFDAAHAAGAWTGIDATAVKIGSDIAELKSAFSDTLGIHEIALLDNHSIANGASSAVVIPSNIQTEDGYACCCVECQEGDIFVIKGRGGNTTRLWSFSDVNGAILSISDRIADVNKLEITAPENAKYFAANFNMKYAPYWVNKGAYTDKTLTIDGKPADAKETGDRIKDVSDTIESNLGYWRQYIEIPEGSGHSASNDILSVDIKAGQPFMLRFSMNRMYDIQIYAKYNDGTSERVLTIGASNYPYSKSLYHISPKSKDITGISQFTVTDTSVRTCITEVILENGITNIIDYYRASLTGPRIQYPDGIAYFETGRARFDVNTIHQSIAVWNNQVWEFGEGKATYNGIVYELENGHANCCNWGKELHGNYPFLYCPKLIDKTINVFSFDGTEFTLENTITIQIDGTGSLNAYIDEENGFIYGFIASTTEAFFVADMTGAVLYSKPIMYKIPTIQNLKLHNGILYVVSGFGTNASPNYLNKITTDGSLIGRYPMRNIGEIEGIDFLGDEMILASYYNFYIHPTKIPNPFRLTSVFDQLKATT